MTPHDKLEHDKLYYMHVTTSMTSFETPRVNYNNNTMKYDNNHKIRAYARPGRAPAASPRAAPQRARCPAGRRRAHPPPRRLPPRRPPPHRTPGVVVLLVFCAV